jgi:hypothetical protein
MKYLLIIGVWVGMMLLLGLIMRLMCRKEIKKARH